MRKQKWYRELEAEIERLKQTDQELIILAIDGSSAAGKTTLAEKLAARYNAQLFHTDDYFLPAEQRTEERLAAVGEFFDKERLLAEVLEPLWTGQPVIFRKFDCANQSFSQPQLVKKSRIVIIEGVYSLHPDLRKFYDLQVFLYVGRAEQVRRLQARNPEKLDQYLEDWLPREKAYFDKYNFRQENYILES